MVGKTASKYWITSLEILKKIQPDYILIDGERHKNT